MSVNIFSIIAGSVSMLTALCAVWISFKVYSRQKSLENENHFFKYKIEQYQELINDAYDLLNVYQEIIDDGRYMIDTAFDQQDIDKLILKIDKKTNEFRKTLTKFTLFLPQEILDKLEVFYDNLYGKLEIREGMDINADFDKIEELTISLINRIEEIINMMRKDIGVDMLNHKLNKRIEK